MASYNYTAKMGAPVTQYDESANAYRAGGAGGVVGKLVGDVLDAKQTQDNQAKVQGLLSAYNARQAPFGAPNRSDDTKTLSRLLLPVDRELAAKYMAQGNAESAEEMKLAANRKVMEAGANVPGTKEVAMDDAEIASIDEEIAAIENELRSRASEAGSVGMQSYTPAQSPAPNPSVSGNRDFSRYMPSFNPWVGSTTSKQDYIPKVGA